MTAAGVRDGASIGLAPAAVARCALRKKPDGPLLPSAPAVEPEHRAIAALQGSAMPVDWRQVQAHFPRRER